MTNIVSLHKDEKFEVEYIKNIRDEIVGISHPKWTFDIIKKDGDVALVSEDGEPFGILPKDQFNTILMCWLLIDDPKLIDEAKL